MPKVTRLNPHFIEDNTRHECVPGSKVQMNMDKINQVIELLKEPHAGDEYVVQAILMGRVCVAQNHRNESTVATDIPSTSAPPEIPSTDQYQGGYYEGDVFVSTNVELMHRIFEVQDGNLYFRDRKRNPFLRTKQGIVRLYDSDVSMIMGVAANPVLQGEYQFAADIGYRAP